MLHRFSELAYRRTYMYSHVPLRIEPDSLHMQKCPEHKVLYGGHNRICYRHGQIFRFVIKQFLVILWFQMIQSALLKDISSVLTNSKSTRVWNIMRILWNWVFSQKSEKCAKPVSHAIMSFMQYPEGFAYAILSARTLLHYAIVSALTHLHMQVCPPRFKPSMQ